MAIFNIVLLSGLLIALSLRKYFNLISAFQLARINVFVSAIASLPVFWELGPAPLYVIMLAFLFSFVTVWSEKSKWILSAAFLHVSFVLLIGWLQFETRWFNPNSILQILYHSWGDFFLGYAPMPVMFGAASFYAKKFWNVYVNSKLKSDAYLVSIAALKQQEQVSLLARGIVHDINNLLVPLLDHNEIIGEGLAKCAGEHRDEIQMLKGNEEIFIKLRHLLGLLLRYSSKNSESFEKLNVEEVMNEIQPILKSAVKPRGDLQLICNGNLPLVSFNRLLIFQIMSNLVRNSIDAESDDRRLSILVELSSNFGVDIVVSDNGKGMPANVLNKIFEVGFTTKGEHGTGLGLSTVQAMVEMGGGSMKAASVEGAGASISIHLPSA